MSNSEWHFYLYLLSYHSIKKENKMTLCLYYLLSVETDASQYRQNNPEISENILKTQSSLDRSNMVKCNNITFGDIFHKVFD